MVTTQYAPVTQAGNGVTLAFNFNFKILAQTDLVVSKTDASGNPSGTLILGADYTVTFDPIAESGTVTYTVAPVSGGSSIISRSSSYQQQTSLPREGPLPAKTVETMLDRVTMILQEISAGTGTGSGSGSSAAESSGLYASKPTNPTIPTYYYSTDKQLYEKWVPSMAAWIVLGGKP